MIQRTVKRIRRVVTVAAALTILAVVGYAVRKHRTPPAKAVDATKPESPRTTFVDYKAPTGTPETERVLRITPDTVLASINGHALTAKDIFPPGSSGQDISLEVCEYFRQRAVDRELIFQTAKAQDLGLTESQQQQLANVQRQRGQQGPGLVQTLAGGSESLSFELRDDEAFMLQTSLMEKAGASPNVSSRQVTDYYQQHQSEFGALPVNEPARQQAWERIDFTIREVLAFSVRSDFQRKLTDYMNQLKTGADIQLTPLGSFAHANK